LSKRVDAGDDPDDDPDAERADDDDDVQVRNDNRTVAVVTYLSEGHCLVGNSSCFGNRPRCVQRKWKMIALASTRLDTP
jgi:hypothetical protein